MSADATARPRRIFHHSAGAVVFYEGRCLLIRRGSEWAFPKGHLEREESPEDAALREVKEETGIQIELVAPLGPTRYEFKSHNGTRNRKQVDWFLARRVSGDIVHEPIFSEARFVPTEEALRLLTHAADRALLERAIAWQAGPEAEAGPAASSQTPSASSAIDPGPAVHGSSGVEVPPPASGEIRQAG